MKYYLVSATGRLLAKDGVTYTDHVSQAMWFNTWEDAYAHNCECYSGMLVECSEEDV
jgi:hypothetical protein